MMFKILLVVAAFVALANADCYMQNPRGSNDRLRETNTNRNNQERLFDSQNNAKGGYCWGPKMYYYVGSLLSIQWTTQHSCGMANNDCEVVIQYMCGDNVRDGDGSTTNTPPSNDGGAALQQVGQGVDPQPIYGLHESYQYYRDCYARDRNKGLFSADQGNNGNLRNDRGATVTRQNNNGNGNNERTNPGGNSNANSGYECPEERDYYPYWHPTPWKDIAVLTSRPDRCDYYRAESENVKGRNYCSVNTKNNEVECTAAGGTWNIAPSHDLNAPDCQPAPWIRDNHLGNTLNGHNPRYNWTIPDQPHPNCVLRIRYNITTHDAADFWSLTSKDNGVRSPVKGDPKVFTHPNTAGNAWRLILAIDTNEFGRTFQDRSHTFEIRARPADIDLTRRIWNLNVRGKRGNIVQTYPATEYDFVPTVIQMHAGDMLHIQWTGCDFNPAGNDGEGRDSTDRSNIAQLKNNNIGANIHFSFNDTLHNKHMFFDVTYQARLAWIDQVACESYEQLQIRDGPPENADITQLVTNCMVLNGAPSPYFDGGVVAVTRTGVMNFISTRNNNFSNRAQKGVLMSTQLVETFGIVLLAIAGAAFAAAIVVALIVKLAPGSSIAASAVGV